MQVERFEDIPGPDGSDGLLATIIRNGPMSDGVRFFTDPACAHQVASIRQRAGHVIPAHRHIHHRREFCLTQEVLVVMRGRMVVDFYNYRGERVGNTEVGAGDVVILLRGGHGMSILEEVEMFEIKLGPYPGRDKDKMEFPP